MNINNNSNSVSEGIHLTQDDITKLDEEVANGEVYIAAVRLGGGIVIISTEEQVSYIEKTENGYMKKEIDTENDKPTHGEGLFFEFKIDGEMHVFTIDIRETKNPISTLIKDFYVNTPIDGGVSKFPETKKEVSDVIDINNK